MGSAFDAHDDDGDVGDGGELVQGGVEVVGDSLGQDVGGGEVFGGLAAILGRLREELPPLGLAVVIMIIVVASGRLKDLFAWIGGAFLDWLWRGCSPGGGRSPSSRPLTATFPT